MVQFYSEYNAAQSRHEKACREANAADPDYRKSLHQSIAEKLASEGAQAIDEYEQKTKAMPIRSLIDADSRSIRWGIVKNARRILAGHSQQ
jgi:hypothetical protein